MTSKESAICLWLVGCPSDTTAELARGFTIRDRRYQVGECAALDAAPSGRNDERPSVWILDDEADEPAGTRVTPPGVWLVLLDVPDEERQRAIYERGGEVHVSPRRWASPALPVLIDRLADRAVREHAFQRERSRQQQAAERLLTSQRSIIGELLETEPVPPTPIPQELRDQYRMFLQRQIVDGRTGEASDWAALIDVLVIAELSPRSILELHRTTVRRLQEGLGDRSARHLADVGQRLAIGLMCELAEYWRRAAD